jgi:hypothetical protein
MDSINDNKNSVDRFDELMALLESALQEADAMDLAIVGIRISEAIDALVAVRAD